MKTANSPASLARIVARDQARLAVALGLDQGEGRLEAQVLLAKALGVNRAYLIAHAEDSPDEVLLNRYHVMLERRLSGEPVAYILGEKEFYGLNLQVGPGVLIPRPETELLVELVLERIPVDRPAHLLDLGTGSGAIAIALARHRPLAMVSAVDRSLAALDIAQANAVRLGLTNISFLESDWFAAIAGKAFDLIVSNPPYVADNDPHLLQGDVRFEPEGALKGGETGLDCIRKIASEAGAHLQPGGWLLFEHGYDQATACREILQNLGFVDVGSARDLAGIPRASYGRKE